MNGKLTPYEVEGMPTLLGKADFDASKHPRGAGGRFGAGFGTGRNRKPSANPEYLAKVYHGTSTMVIADIKKNGLLPAKPEGRLYPGEHYRGSRGESVYTTNSKGEALAWARRGIQIEAERMARFDYPGREWSRLPTDVARKILRSYEKQFKPVVIECRVPMSMLKPDSHARWSGAQVIKGGIPPEYIGKVHKFKEESVTIYVPIIVKEG